MSFARKLFALILTVGLVFQSPAYAATYFYRYGVTPAAETASAPSSPAPIGVFTILIDSPVPNVASIGDSYTATTYVYSNVGSVAFSVQSGALPAGITINPATGTISGSPLGVGTSSAVIQGIDTVTGKVATAAITIDTIDPFSISGNPGAVVTVNTPYSASFSLSGGSEPYGFSIGATPSGLSFVTSASTATLSGIPSVPGIYGIAVVGSEAHGLSVQYPFSLTVADLLSLAGSPPASGTVGVAYSGQLVVSGGAAPFSYALFAGTLPPGLMVKAATGIISGVPVAAGAKNGIRIKVTDASGQSAISAPFSIVISASGAQPLALSGTGVPNGIENVSYSSQFTAGGGSGGYVYSLVSGTLPAGLSLNSSTGLISGSPAFGSVGSYPGIAVQVTDSALHVVTSNPFTLSIAPGAVPLAISGVPVSSVQQGSNYAVKFTGTGGSGAGYVYAVTSGTLPHGLSLNSSTGLISGTATTVGTYPGIVVRVMDSSAHTASTAPFSIAVGAPPPLSITGSPTPSVNQGANYSAIWTAFDGSGAGYHFTSVGAALPPGLTLSDINGVQGFLSGTATLPGVYSGLQIQVQDSDGNVALSNLFTVTIVPTASPSSPLIISGVADGGQVGEVYSAQFVASGGVSPYVYAVASGMLPSGLTLDPATGLISGTPVVGGVSSGITVSVTDAVNTTVVTAPFSISVVDSSPLTISWTPQTNWQVGDFVAVAVTVSGGDSANYVFSINGTLPPGLSLFSSGALVGSLSEAGTFGPFSVTVSDGVRTATTDPATFNVASPGLFVSGFPPYNATEGVAYSVQYTAQGGSGSGYVYSMVGVLPAGLVLDPATGLISGTPAGGSAGTYSNLAVNAVDDGNNSAVSAVFSIKVQTPSTPLVVSGSPSPITAVGSSYSANFVASGGSGSGYIYSMVGMLPSGLTLNATSGVLSGTPAAGSDGTYSGLKVHVVDAMSNEVDSTPFSIVVHSAPTPLVVSGSASSAATVGVSYSASFSASGGSGSGYVYSMVGTLPSGLTLNTSTGELSGTPVVGSVGSYSSLQVHVVDDAGGQADSILFSIIVQPVPTGLAISGSPLGTAVEGVTYSSVFTASGGSGSGYVYSIMGTLPPGLALNSSTGTLSGTPTTAGSYPGLAVRVTDSASATATSSSFSITVAPASAPLSIAGFPDEGASLTSPYNSQFTASGGAGGYVYSMIGTLPSGLSLDPLSGLLSGNASGTAGTTYSGLAVKVTDSVSVTATSATFSITLINGGILKVLSPPPIAVINIPYSYRPVFTGGSGSYPNGFTNSPVSGTNFLAYPARSGFFTYSPTDGSIVGTVSNTGTGVFTYHTFDSNLTGLTSPPISIKVNPPIFMSLGSTPTGVVGQAYSSVVAGPKGGFENYSLNGIGYTTQSGPSLASLGLAPVIDSKTGYITLSGIPTATGTWKGTFSAVDVRGYAATTSQMTITINPAP